MTSYEQMAGIVSQIRNARFGEMVNYNEALIKSEAWRDFTTPAGTHFKFLKCEYDYFLAAQELDATTLRYAYLKAPATAAQLLRLADITGRGQHGPQDRRTREDVAKLYAAAPGGAGKRIAKWGQDRESVVTSATARIAADKHQRQQYLKAAAPKRTESTRRRWMVQWQAGAKTAAEAIVEKLKEDPALAREVCKKLNTIRISTLRLVRTKTG